MASNQKPSLREEIDVSYSKRARMGLAMGVFLILSLVVFSAMFYIAYCACNVEVLASGADDAMRLEDYRNSIAIDPNPSIRRGDIEYVPDSNPNPVYSIRRGPIEWVPDYNPNFGIGRGPIRALPDFNPYLGIRYMPVVISPL